MDRGLTRLALGITLILLSVRAPTRTSAQASHPTWRLCREHLDWPTASHVVRTVCTRYPLKHETRRPLGHRLIVSRRVSPHVVEHVWWPVFRADPTLLPGCPPAIARWAGYIVPAARRNGLPVPIMTGVMWNESKGDPTAYNPSSGASGLYQFLPSTAAQYGIDPWNPAQATAAAAVYIRQHGLASFSGGGYASAWGCD